MSLPQENAAPPNPALSLTPRRKAALVVQMLLDQGKGLSLRNLPADVQINLTRELSQLRIVDRATLHAVAVEFSDHLARVGLTAPGTLDGTVAALADRISPDTAAHLTLEEASRRIASDPWAQIARLEEDDLLMILQNESIEVAAVALSKLAVPQAASLLGRLTGDRARSITFAVSKTRTITPASVDRIGHALAQGYCVTNNTAFDGDPDARIGAILDNSGARTRDAVLDGLQGDDPDLADRVRKSIFTFPDIATRVRPLDIPNVTRAVPPDALVTALTYALAAGGDDALSAEFVLSNISQRLADQMREDIGERGKIRAKDGEDAMKEVTSRIRDASDAGEITLIATDDDDEAAT